MRTTYLTQILEILQKHGLMGRSDETFVSAQDLVSLDAQLEAIRMDDEDWGRCSPVGPSTTVNDVIAEQKRRIRDLENRIANALDALE